MAGWYVEQGSDPVSGPVSKVVNSLAHLFEEGYQSHSLNAFRSAISSIHDRVDGVEVGQYPMVAMLLKEAFHARPPLPCYSATQNVQTVLHHIESLGSTTTLSLKLLTQKLVMLMALTRPSQYADLSSLSISRWQYKPGGVLFLPATLAKQSRSG